MNRLFGLVILTAASLSGVANAFDTVSPGSLLIYPEYDNTAGSITILTVTNTSADKDVVARFNYIDSEECQIFDRDETLTPNDTLTLVTKVHTPHNNRGFVYVVAMDPVEGVPIKHNWLIGTTRFIEAPSNGLLCGLYSLQPFTYLGIAPNSNSKNTLFDLDGIEYEQSPAEHLVPNFIGYKAGAYESELILIGLAGGAAFQTRVDFLIYNDNEEVFSTSYTFHCWEKVATAAVSPAFLHDFLVITNHDPNEILGIPALEAGWFRAQGNVATSSAVSIQDPAIRVALIQRIASLASEDLAFGLGQNKTGKLWSLSITGDQ
jgi:hypothetical protein